MRDTRENSLTREEEEKRVESKLNTRGKSNEKEERCERASGWN
jgi:hypothetical protein